MTLGNSPVRESSCGLKTKQVESGLRSASGSKAGGYGAAHEAPLKRQLSNYQLSTNPNGRRGNGPPIFSRFSVIDLTISSERIFTNSLLWEN